MTKPTDQTRFAVAQAQVDDMFGKDPIVNGMY